MIEHTCCGFRTRNNLTMRNHMKVCARTLEIRNQVSVVEIDGMRITAGHPDAVARYKEEKCKRKYRPL